MADISTLSPVEQVQAVEDIIKLHPQTVYEVRHTIGGGVYEREVLVPAGEMITGKIHLTEHLAKLVQGTMTIYSEHESGTVTGPKTFVSKPGVKRVGYAHDDCVFATYHYIGTETDINKIEALLVVENAEQYLERQAAQARLT